MAPPPPNHLSTTTILLTILTLLLTPTQSQEDPSCTNRSIYILNLPSRFNLDLLSNCSTYLPLSNNLCPFLSNHGLGPKTHNRSHSWFRSDPRLLELFFHRRLLEYPCLTTNPEYASAVYIPYYGGIDSLRYLYGPDYNSSYDHGRDLFNTMRTFTSEIWRRNNGHDHFMVMARTAWDFSQPLPTSLSDDVRVWGTSFLMLPEFVNVTVLTLESRAWPWQEVAVPHPTSFHPPSLALMEAWVVRARRSRRSTLMLFAGGGGKSVSGAPNIRRSIREECDGYNSTNADRVLKGKFLNVCEIVDCSHSKCEHDPIRYMKPMLQASFCLQPPGETPARRSTFDGIVAGCIPVFFEDNSAKSQYKWHLPEAEFAEFSVTIPKEDVVFKGVKVVDVLMKIPRAKVMRMREKVMEMIPRVTYRKHGSSLGLKTKKDAFDIAIDGTLQRIKDRLAQASVASSV